MSEKTRKIIVFGILILVGIWGYSNISERMARNKKKAQENAAQTQPGAADDPASFDAASPQIKASLPAGVFDQYDDLNIKTNPFYHNWARVENNREIELHLLGILYRAANAQALINGQVVKVGDTIDGYTITAITNESVALRKDGEDITLRPKKETS
ncbi:MAG: hypothetical protein R3F48_09850 [Candidatus Zixiibacteriota bacterium]